MQTLFKSFVEQHHLFTPDQVVLLAVSGGRDSVALLHLMRQSGFQFAIAHCNFHIRPLECDRDQEFVRSLAQSYGVPFHLASFQCLSYAAEHHLSVEQAARQQRYTFFHSLCSSHGYTRIVTGHHADDSMETFFINLLRGTGIAGLHGIRPLQGIVARPLLPFSRQQINEYVATHQLSYVEDSTNASDDYRRNQIRHQLIPLLRQLAPSIDHTLPQTMEHLAQVEEVLLQQVSLLSSTHLQPSSDGKLHLVNFSSLSPVLLYHLLKPYGFNASQTSDLLTHSHTGAHFFSSTHQLTVERSFLVLEPLSASPSATPPSVLTQTFLLSEVSLQSLLHPLDGTLPQRHFLLLDADQVSLPLVWRHWSQGDRFRPFGMRGSQLLSDYFSTHKFTHSQRQSQWLLTDAHDHILWIAGHRASALAPVTSLTTSVLKVLLPQ